MQAYPEWLHILAWVYIGVALLCSLIILFDELRTPQKMGIMNLVWPITALYWGPGALWGYLKAGRKVTKEHHQRKQRQQEQEEQENRRVMRAGAGRVYGFAEAHGQAGSEQEESGGQHLPAAQVALADSHCGAGCTLGDIAAESSVAAFGLMFAGAVFPTRLVMDFLLAWTFGIVFQYLTIVPMRGLPFGRGLLAAIRADTFSIVAFQMGLFGWMALTYYVIFPGPHLRVDEAVFWFMMQVGMILGFFTAYPVNKILLRIGWKERMQMG